MILAEGSEFEWLASHLPNGGVWIVIILAALFFASRVIDGSEKIAKYIPLVGKKIHARSERKKEARRKLAREEAEAAIAELEPPDYAHRVEHLEQSNAKLEERLDLLEQKDDVAHEWRCVDEIWHRDDELERAENGHPIKPRITFREFAARWYAGERYRNGMWVKPGE